MLRFNYKNIFNILSIVAILNFSFVPLVVAAQNLDITAQEEELYNKSAAQDYLEVEKQQNQAKSEIQKTLVPEAIKAIEETKNAIDLINNNQIDKAIEAIERALGKIDILLTRYLENSFLPVDFIITVIDEAPTKFTNIKNINKLAHQAIDDKVYPYARMLLENLRSEVSIVVYNLSLEIYPGNLKNAVSLLENNNINEAKIILTTALNTLAIIERTIPIPVINAEVLVNRAKQKYENNPDIASDLLILARYELLRAKELGYSSKNQQYNELIKSLKQVEKKVRNKKKNIAAFSNLQSKLKSFLKEYSEIEKSAPKN